MILSCGESTGIKEGELVISGGYLVGKLLHVGKLTSTVLLITNSQSSVDAKVSRSGIEGAVKGSFGSGLTLELIPQTADLQKGDEVVTAGINSITPPNILIGTIGDTLSKQSDLFKRTTVLSPLNVHSVDFVFVAKE
jgi:rod shape-determining protein MreC